VLLKANLIQSYDVSGIKPLPDARKEVEVKGQLANPDIKPCMGPPVICKITWKYTGGVCPGF
jgi:hypothetical protein